MSKRGCSGRWTPPVVTSASRHSSRGFLGLTNGGTALAVEPDEHDVPVLSDVVAAFETDLRLLAGPGKGSGGHHVGPVPDLRRDKAALHVGVDPACGPPRRRALPDRPRPALLLVEGEERDEAEQPVRCPYELLEARRLHPEHLHVLPRLVLGQLRDLGLEPRREPYGLRPLARGELLHLGAVTVAPGDGLLVHVRHVEGGLGRDEQDRKSTRLNSSHANISYAVFCLKKKKQKSTQ